VSFRADEGGMLVADIANAASKASIALQGAHLLSWEPVGEKPVIWLSPAAKFAPGKSVRGGVPVCWPWFGPHSGEKEFPAHGHARTVAWEVLTTAALDDHHSKITFRLIHTEAHNLLWPYPTPVQLHITVGPTLELELITQNQSAQDVVIGQALHTYFEVSDVRQVQVLGLEGLPYLDNLADRVRKLQEGAVGFTEEVDRIYLEHGGDCCIEDPLWARRIRISKTGSHSTVVWNPWIAKSERMGDFGADGYLRMLCVESANAVEDVVSIAPGAEHRLWVRYQVEATA
jgi:glucose-6-phosphate 1-epimerase